MEARELAIITEKGELLYDPTKVDEIMAAVCYRATCDDAVLHTVLRMAAALIGAATDSKQLQLRFNDYIIAVRNALKKASND